MRRQKRDRTERAFQKGYLAGMNGKSKEACPIEVGSLHQEWINGWREGRIDLREGRTGVRGVHRVAEMTMH